METTQADKQKKLMVIIYACWAAGLFSNVVHIFGILPFVALILAALKKNEMMGTIYESHCIWIIRTFIIGFMGAIIAMALMLLPPVGMLAIGILGLWVLWRLIKGGMRLYEGKPVENPRAFF